MNEGMSYIHTNNIVSDSIINYFYELYSKSITFHIDGKFPENLFVENNDLCTILSNLIKNAVESSIQEISPSIYISLSANEEFATIDIKNTSRTYSESELSGLKTQKEDKKNHGFGLKNVSASVTKYAGVMEIECENNLFCTKIYLHNLNQK